MRSFVLFTIGAAVMAGLAAASTTADPPLLVAWTRVGDISLGEQQSQVEAGYGSRTFHVAQRYGTSVQGYYRLHGTRLIVTFTNHRVDEIDFASPYYRTNAGFGVGSKIPFGPCVKTWTHRCGHIWHGFVWNEVYREQPCGCWAKVGMGKRSLRPTADNFRRRWIQIFVKRGRVTEFYFSLHYVD